MVEIVILCHCVELVALELGLWGWYFGKGIMVVLVGSQWWWSSR